MRSVSRREVIGLVSAGVVTVAMGSRVSGAAKEKPLTPETIVAKEFEGKATVEFTVGKAGVMLHGRIFMADESEPLHIAPKAGRVYVVVSWETATRLKRLGIENPAEHFRGKVVRVSGTVERLAGSSGAEYRIQVTNLDQIEVIRKP